MTDTLKKLIVILTGFVHMSVDHNKEKHLLSHISNYPREDYSIQKNSWIWTPALQKTAPKLKKLRLLHKIALLTSQSLIRLALTYLSLLPMHY